MSFCKKQSCKRPILSPHAQSGDIEESVQMPERTITSASTMTQPNSYMYMCFNDQSSDVTRSDVTTGHDLASLINGYATYTTTHPDQPGEPIYEVKLTSTVERKMFTMESQRSESHYLEAENALEGTRGVQASTEQGTTPDNAGRRRRRSDEEYEHPYEACKVSADGHCCNTNACSTSNDQEPPTERPESSDSFPTSGRGHGSTSSSEDYCQADAVPVISITEVPIDGTYTALIKHPEPEYSTTLVMTSEEDESPRDRSNIVGYVTSVSPVSIKQTSRSFSAVRRNTGEHMINKQRPPSESRLRLHQFTDVAEPVPQGRLPEPGSYVNDRIPAPVGKDGRIKRPIPAPRARLLPAHLSESTEDTVL